MTMLSPQTLSASRLAAALAVQVRNDLEEAGFVDDVSTVAGLITASLLTSAASSGAWLQKISSEMKP